MTRRFLNSCVRNIADQIRDRPFAYWKTRTFPEVFQQTCNGRVINVELNLLEDTQQYLHIGIAVDDGRWLSTYWPVTTSIIVNKNEPV